MKITFADLWRPGGTIDRGTYALVGVLGFALKHNLDRLVATYGFHRRWGLFNYWMPVRDVARITQLRSNEAVFLGTLVALALPFIWVGVAMTMKRLRSARLPPQLVALFFVPLLNLLFFLLLCLLPAREPSGGDETTDRNTPAFLARVLPESALGSAAVSFLFTVPIGLGMALLASQLLMNYGWGLFVALPFTMGLVGAVIYGLRQPRSLRSCVGVACLSTLLLGASLMGLAFEGLFCLVMALPITLPLAAFGGVCAYGVQQGRWFRSDARAYLSVLLILVPGIEWTEHVVATPARTFVVHSAIEVQAPPEKVWRAVVAFSEISPPAEWMFRAGIAYPIRAEMAGSGVGAERHCVFSTGAFIEPIQIWDAPRRLKFSVTANPPPMEEWTPYGHIEPPHLHGFLVSNGGQFLLTPLPSGGTRLEGTTWYHHGLRPAAYWRLWSDAIIHQIHLRVLRHIRDEAEKKTLGRR
ncbi:MAG TPA: hypothetical protein VEK84_00445 [Terriglobales bacterium]|nr:hypothetical protein [Terriglobales bacterium]